MEYGPWKTAAYLAGKIDEYVKQQARDTIMQNVSHDRFARYARIPDSGACEFCQMLGSRGFVYHSEEAAGGEHNDYHPHCNCQIAVSFDPQMVRYYMNGTTESRGYDMSGRYDDRYDIDALYLQYVEAGKSYKSSSRYADYAETSKLTGSELAAAKASLAEARTLDELHDAGKMIVDDWKPGRAGRDSAQWKELSAYAQKLEREMQGTVVSSKAVAGVSASVDPELRAWARQFPNEEIWLEKKGAKPFHKEGDPLGVMPSDKEDALYRGGKARHTHTTPIGGTFGSEDVWYTTEMWFEEHIVIDTHNGMSFRLTRGPGAIKESAEDFAREFEQFSDDNYDRLLAMIYDANGGDAAHGYGATLEEKITVEIALKGLQHDWLEENAKRWGYVYDADVV